MAKVTFRANTQQMLLPLLAQLQGETVVIPENDQTYVPNINPGDSQAAVERGIPGVYYCQNVMPSTYGFQSVGYLEETPTLGKYGKVINVVKVPRSTSKQIAYAAELIAPDGRRVIVVLNSEKSNWAGVWDIPGNLPQIPMTVATIRGVTYLHYSGIGLFRVNSGSQPFLEQVHLKGVEMGNVIGVVGSMGYMVCYTTTGVAWSSTSDPLDFEPSDITGAGSGDIQDAAGDILLCLPTPLGFIIYTRGNAVQATFSGNVNYPWNFRAIPGSGGIQRREHVSVGSNGQHYAYTAYGLQQIYHTGAKSIFPYVTDFLSGNTMDWWDWGTESLEKIVFDNTQNFQKQVAFIADRYLVISYGLPWDGYYSNAIALDIVQGRMGKLARKHTCLMEWQDTSSAEEQNARRAIGLVNEATNKVETVNFDLRKSEGADAILLLGKFQVARGLMSQMLSVSIEQTNEDFPMSLHLQPSIDGKNPMPGSGLILGYLTENTENHKKYLFHDWGKSHSLLVSGTFNISSVILDLHVDGSA